MKYSDHELMKMTIQESLESKFEDTYAHPKVGAIITKNDKILGMAHRNEDGKGTHAEVFLIREKLKYQSLEGCVLYSTLEPSFHRDIDDLSVTGLILEHKIARVFYGMEHPNPDVTHISTILQEANIEAIRYDHDLIYEIETINEIFKRKTIDSKLRLIKSDPEFIKKLSHNTLDEWYVSVNKIYWNLNYFKSPYAIFSHLVEVIGGMSLIASDKKKIGIIPKAYIVKAIAWWFALCGKLGVRSVSTLLWNKFPNVCPYCLLNPHSSTLCTENKKLTSGPNWEKVGLFKSNIKDQPITLKDWQLLFFNIYPMTREETYGFCFARLTEELGELAEAIRVFSTAPGHFLSEAADVFAWLMHTQNLIELKSDTSLANMGIKIGMTFAEYYPGYCKDCEKEVCICPPILKKTIGRITSEVPLEKGTFGVNASFYTPEESSRIFGLH